MRPLPPASFDGLDRSILRWLDYEQTVNERLIHEIFLPHRHQQTTVRPRLRPERRPVWEQRLVWMPRPVLR